MPTRKNATTAKSDADSDTGKTAANPGGKSRLSRMSPAELEAYSARFDREHVADEARDLTPDERRQYDEAIGRGPGRPPVGEGAAKIRVSVERALLRGADAEAKRRDVSRSELIALGLKALGVKPAAADA